MRAVDELLAYPKNARKHDEGQIATLVRVINDSGFTTPLLVDPKGVIIAGHGRLIAAQRLGMREVPCVSVEGLTTQQINALRISDNAIANRSTWDLDMLRAEIGELRVDGFDLDLAGFAALELGDILRQAPAADPEAPIPDEAASRAWLWWAQDLEASLELLAPAGSPRQGLGRGFALWSFLQARYRGLEYPRFCSLAFHPSQLDVVGDKFSLREGIRRAAIGSMDVDRLRFVCQDTMSVDKLLASTLPMAGARPPSDFPADLAKDLISEFAPGLSSVLDPCHGWGGRLVGFLLSGARYYAGTDPSPETSKGTADTWETLGPYAEKGKVVELACLPFEDWEPQKRAFDFALTSPPYFDTERYQGGEQSRDRYPTYGQWREGFYRVLIEKTHSLLKPGAVFALQIGSQRYPLLEDGRKLAIAAGFNIDSIRDTGMINNRTKTERIDGEVIMLLRKRANAPKLRAPNRAKATPDALLQEDR